ncbi:MAG: MBL fold metallo-hydrolase [bacterium]|nr:MBL fold metallo-hydrolase [bacterium]
MSVEITFLGTASVTPEAGCDTASFLIGRKILVDTGWYSAIRMLDYGFSPLDLEYLILTHCHHDHYIGLPHLLFYRRMRQKDRAELPPLKIIGPEADVQRVVDRARGLLQVDRFPDVDHVPNVFPLAPGKCLETDTFRLDTCATIHAVQGLCVRFADKETGSVFGFTGDTAYHPPIAKHLNGCPLIVHEATHGARVPENAFASGHSTAVEAARIAVEAGAERLALVHMRENEASAAVEAARQIFSGAFRPGNGEAVAI